MTDEYEVTITVRVHDGTLTTDEVKDLVSERLAEGENIEGVEVKVETVKWTNEPHRCNHCGLLGGH